MLAARLAAVPHRIHTFTGQVWVTRCGWRRSLLSRPTACSLIGDRALVDSPSQREFLLAQSVLAADKSTVIGKGSICGVDCTRFRPDDAARHVLRGELGSASSAPVLLFLGRLNRDKGILDLAAAFVWWPALSGGTAFARRPGRRRNDQRRCRISVPQCRTGWNLRLHASTGTFHRCRQFSVCPVIVKASASSSSRLLRPVAGGCVTSYGITDAVVDGQQASASASRRAGHRGKMTRVFLLRFVARRWVRYPSAALTNL